MSKYHSINSTSIVSLRTGMDTNNCCLLGKSECDKRELISSSISLFR